MGKNKEEFEKMRYVVFTEPISEQQFYLDYVKEEFEGSLRDRDTLRDWKREPDDYEKLFKDDLKHKELSKKYKDARKNLENYKDLKRELNKKEK